MTIHTAQGSTNREHISALPAGSQAIDGLLGYSANTRHTQKLWLVSSDNAEQIAVRKSRPLNDTRPITTEDKWAAAQPTGPHARPGAGSKPAAGAQPQR
jgi:hypothetical protein